MLLNIRPLRENRDFRLLFFAQLISFLGSMVSYVAVPYQVYALTKDNALVGLLGIVQLLPVIVLGILGGTYADRLNRRKLLIVSEFLMCLLVLILALNGARAEPSVIAVFVTIAIFQGVSGFHRPALDALVQKIIKPEDYATAGALGSFRYSLGAIAGPALGGVLISQFGVSGAFFFDFLTFLVALILLARMTKMPDPDPRETSPFEDMKAGLRYAFSKPELIGTYTIDIVAMVFAFPVALFPAMSEAWGGANAAGLLFSAMAVGSLILTLFSGWTSKIVYQGRGVVIAAALWALFIVGVGYASTLWVAVGFLALAGAADMTSGLFRGIIWNRSIPNEMRGRLSGIEMISYMSGPLLGNARAGWMAAKVSVPFSLTAGGWICTVAVVLTAFCLPKLWNYEGRTTADSPSDSTIGT